MQMGSLLEYVSISAKLRQLMNNSNFYWDSAINFIKLFFFKLKIILYLCQLIKNNMESIIYHKINLNFTLLF